MSFLYFIHFTIKPNVNIFGWITLDILLEVNKNKENNH